MITKYTSALRARLARFAQDTKGSVNIEATLMFPLLITMIASSMVFYDAFRRDALAQKAAYTVGDMISRETSAIGPDYLGNIRTLVALMADTPESDVTVRVTQVQSTVTVSEPAGNDLETATTITYSRNWSKVDGSRVGTLSSSDVAGMAAQLPTMYNAERVLLVDVYINYDWPIDLGLDDMLGEDTFHSRVFTRPRFAPKVTWSSSQ